MITLTGLRGSVKAKSGAMTDVLPTDQIEIEIEKIEFNAAKISEAVIAQTQHLPRYVQGGLVDQAIQSIIEAHVLQALAGFIKRD